MNDLIKNPVWLLAAGGALGLTLWGLLSGIAQLLPAVGVMISLAVSGTAAGFTIAPAMGTIASCGAAATGLVLSVQLTVRIMREAKKEPLAWGTPILGLLSGFLVQMCEQFWSGPKFVWFVFSLVAGLLVVIGGVLYGQKGLSFKIAGAAACLVVPVAVLFAVGSSRPKSLSELLLAGSIELWLPLGLLVVVACILGVLAHVSAKHPA
jgi:hypothetical protein